MLKKKILLCASFFLFYNNVFTDDGQTSQKNQSQNSLNETNGEVNQQDLEEIVGLLVWSVAHVNEAGDCSIL